MPKQPKTNEMNPDEYEPQPRQQRDGRHFVFFDEAMGPKVMQPPTPKRRQW